MDLRLNGRTAFVAGATGGLGLACARALAAEGVRVAVVGRREQRAKEVADEIGSGAIAVTTDLADPDSRAAAISVVRAEFGQVDILILNGGGPPPGSATDLSASDAEAAVASLVLPHVDLVRAFLPAMTERRWGRIIAVGSSGVQQPIARLAASNLGRAALAGYLKTLAGEVAADGVTVNMVLPGRIDTDRVRSLDAAAADRQGADVADVRRSSAASIPVGRYGEPEEFAAVVAFLASEPASYVTGEQVRCDGGMVRHH